MSSATAGVGKPGGVPVAPAVYGANSTAKRLHYLLALTVVVTPTVGTIAALAMWLGQGVGFGWTELILLVVFYIITSVGIGVGYHRHFTHRSFQAVTPVRALLGIFGSMAAQGPMFFWVAIHRRHHQFADTAGDAHSPYVQREKTFANRVVGFWHAHTGWLFDTEVTDWGRYIPDLIKDKAMFRVSELYFVWVALGLALPAAIGGLVHGTWEGAFFGFLWGGLVRMFCVHHSTWCINSVCHIFGDRPFKIRDRAANNWLIAIVTSGEGWHNNHHAFPYACNHSMHWWQYDPNYWLISTLKALGLVWDIRNANPQEVQNKLAGIETAAPGGA